MNLFGEVVTPSAHLPVTVAAADMALAAAVVQEIERAVLWRAVVLQTRKIVIDGTLPILELEPVSSIVSITRWTPTDPAEVIDPASYYLVSRDRPVRSLRPRPGTTGPRQNGQSGVSRSPTWRAGRSRPNPRPSQVTG